MTRHDPLFYFDRGSGTIRREVVYGEFLADFCYRHPLGRWFTHLVLKRRVISRLAGLYQESRWSAGDIPAFVARLGLDPLESERLPEAYRSFNAYFTRRLRQGLRPLDPDPRALVSPADARLTVYPALEGDRVVPVKGQAYRLSELLGDARAAERYEGGCVYVLRLCPADYHRFHFAADGRPGPARRIPGDLHSVHPWALETGLKILSGNERQIVVAPGPLFGSLAYIAVGALCVGRIRMTCTPEADARRGDELGYFAFGGSSLILLAEAGRVEADADLVAHSARGTEVRVLQGTRIGRSP